MYSKMKVMIKKFQNNLLDMKLSIVGQLYRILLSSGCLLYQIWDLQVGLYGKILSRFDPDFIQILSRFNPDFIQILSRFYLDFIQILSRFYPDFIQILSRFYPDFIQISFRFYPDCI